MISATVGDPAGSSEWPCKVEAGVRGSQNEEVQPWRKVPSKALLTPKLQLGHPLA